MVGSHLKTNATAPYLIVLLLCFYYIKLLLRKYEKVKQTERMFDHLRVSTLQSHLGEVCFGIVAKN